MLEVTSRPITNFVENEMSTLNVTWWPKRAWRARGYELSAFMQGELSTSSTFKFLPPYDLRWRDLAILDVQGGEHLTMVTPWLADPNY